MPNLTALIPLDGSELSQQALATLPVLRALGVTRLRLVSVGEVLWDDPGGAASAELAESIEKSRSLLNAYLEERARVVAAAGFEVSTAVRVGRPAEEVLAEAEACEADVIAIATHGRSGIERFRLGSVADRVVRGASCPTLVVGPNVSVNLDPYEVKRVLVPLDGSDLGEEALPVAVWLAEEVGASIDLIRIVSLPTVAVEPAAGAYSLDLLQAVEEAARLYLDRIAQGLNTTRTVRTVMLTGTVSEELLRYLAANPADLVVMTSHSRGGIARFLLGSIADRLLHGPSPVLVMRPGAASRLLEDARAARA